MFFANRDPDGIPSRPNNVMGISACHKVFLPYGNSFTEIKLAENRIIQTRQATCSQYVASALLGYSARSKYDASNRLQDFLQREFHQDQWNHGNQRRCRENYERPHP